jgi:Putative metal-binding motif
MSSMKPRMRRALGWLISAGVLVAAREAAAEDCSELGIGELGPPLIEHSCFHSTNGPFVDVSATPGPVAVVGTANVDAVHTHYAVTLAPGQVNVVVYTPVRSGTWAIFTDTTMPLQVIDAGGRELSVRLTHAVSDCPALPLVRVFTLTAGMRYTLRLGAANVAVPETPLVLEKVSDFETLHGRDLDGDGFGGSAEPFSTPCVPPPGYVASISDCDDSDPSVNPGALEVCNGRDDNCNGQGDEDACQLGGGGCNSGVGPEGTEAFGLALLLLSCLLWQRMLGRRRGGGR